MAKLVHQLVHQLAHQLTHQLADLARAALTITWVVTLVAAAPTASADDAKAKAALDCPSAARVKPANLAKGKAAKEQDKNRAAPEAVDRSADRAAESAADRVDIERQVWRHQGVG
jgi:hypothetical protein